MASPLKTTISYLSGNRPQSRKKMKRTKRKTIMMMIAVTAMMRKRMMSLIWTTHMMSLPMILA